MVVAEAGFSAVTVAVAMGELTVEQVRFEEWTVEVEVFKGGRNETVVGVTVVVVGVSERWQGGQLKEGGVVPVSIPQAE